MNVNLKTGWRETFNDNNKLMIMSMIVDKKNERYKTENEELSKLIDKRMRK